jgi:hypothetical protein
LVDTLGDINKKPLQYAIFAHCFTGSSDLGVVRNISRELTGYGFGVLRFDFTGLGSSEGDFADTNFTHNLKTSKIDHIKKKMEFVGDLTKEQKRRLTEIAALCPVHKTLGSATKIETIDE